MSTSSHAISPQIESRPAPIQEYEGHKRAVDCIAFFPNEKKLVSGSWDGKLLEWDLETGLQCGKWWKGHGDAVSGVDVSRDGRMVVSGGRDRTVIIWDEESGEVVQVLEGHQNEVRSVQFSGDSKRVVSGSDDGTVRVWLIEGELAFEPIKCRGEVTCVRYSPNGDRIASGAESVQIWDAETGNGILSIRDSPVWSFSWTPDSDQIIGGGFRKISVWDSHTGEQTRTWETPYHNTALSLSPHGTHLVTSGSFDKSALLYDITTGERIAAFEHDEKVRDIAYSPSGQLLATACTNKKVYLWAAPTFPQSKQSIQKNDSSLLDLPAVINPSAPSGEAEVREVRRAPVGSFLDLPATSRPSRYTKPTGPTTSTHRRSFTQTVRGRVVGLFRRSLEKDHFHSQLSPHTIDPFTSGSTHGPIDNLPKRPQRTRQPTWIAESRTRPIFAFETGPLPDEIERGCFYHLASYICFGQRDPNINPVENVVREIAPLTQSEPGPAQTKSRLLEALNQLLVMLRLRRPPPAPVNTPSSNITRSVFASDGVNNGAPVPTFIPAPHQSSRPAIATPPPTDVTAAQLHAPASVSTSAQALSPSAQVLASTDDTHASVTLTPAITCVAADIELQPRPTIIVTDDQLQNYPAVAATSGPSLSTAHSPQDTYLTPAIVVSPDEMAILQEYRRQKSKFAVATGVADVSSNPSSHHDTRIYPGPSTSKSASLIVASGTPQPWQLPSSPGFPLNLDAQGPRPLLLESNFTHSLSSPPSPASSPALQTFTINEVGPGNLMKPIDNAPADTTPESPHVQPISSYLDQPISSYLDQPAVDQAFADVFQLEEENPWQDA